MVKLTLEQLNEIKAKHNTQMEKLNASIEGTVDGEVGKIYNIDAPCLIRSAMFEAIGILNIINKAEDVAARAGDLEDERKADKLMVLLEECRQAINTAIGHEDGLDGARGEELIEKITAEIGPAEGNTASSESSN